MVGDALPLEGERPEGSGPGRNRGPGDPLQRRAVGPGEGHGRISGDARRQTLPLALRQLLEASGDSLVGVAQALLQAEDLLAHHGEPEVPRLDGAGVDRPDRDLVHSVAGDRDERVAADCAGKRLVESLSRRRGKKVSGHPPWRSHPRGSPPSASMPRRSATARWSRPAMGYSAASPG